MQLPDLSTTPAGRRKMIWPPGPAGSRSARSSPWIFVHFVFSWFSLPRRHGDPKRGTEVYSNHVSCCRQARKV